MPALQVSHLVILALLALVAPVYTFSPCITLKASSSIPSSSIASLTGRVTCTTLLSSPQPSSPSDDRSLLILIDHGSKNTPSNARLHTLASILNSRCQSPPSPSSPSPLSSKYYACLACHMELASPSLLETINSLSHPPPKVFLSPVFISPLGKHVKTDIPKIAEDVQRETGVTVEIGKVVGDDLNLLADAIINVI
mmetsp:Transcript_8792/g.15967  ORF Transcript_8792/g.15967 Transcript_8792/m.15967 type:complete len:196 (+) Transcript_8792:183-770(+)